MIRSLTVGCVVACWGHRSQGMLRRAAATWVGLALWAWLAIGAAVAAAEVKAARGEHRPNIVIILADDLGYSDLGCYGGEIATPNVDRLAAGGVRFTQFYNTARCWPTRTCLMTGYYAQQVGMDPVVKGGRLPAWAPTMAERLKPLGYRTYHSGKWHIQAAPLPVTDAGFDRSYKLDDHDHFFAAQKHTLDNQPLPPDPERRESYATIRIAEHAIDCLREHAARYAQQPFLQYLCFTAPHFPLQALPDDIAKYRDRYDSGWDVVSGARHARQTTFGIVRHALPPKERELGPPYHNPKALEALGPGEVNRPLPWSELTADQRGFQAAKMAVHAAMVERMDQEIGRVVEQLRVMNALENTLIFFLSDNGASAEIMVRGDGHDRQAAPGSAATFLCLGPGWSNCSNTPLRRHKTWVHEGGIATPLVVHWPAGIQARGELRNAPGHAIDLLPTVLELAGALVEPAATTSPPLPGRSLVAALAADVPVERGEIFWHHEKNRALRMGDWKVVSAHVDDDRWCLYNLAIDRGEQHDLASEQPERLAKMTARWQELDAEFRRQSGAAAEKVQRKKNSAAPSS